MKFEYTVVRQASGQNAMTSFPPFMAWLNKLGKEGWELVSVFATGPNDIHEAFLKRLLPE